MTERPVSNQATLSSPEPEFVWGHSPRHPQISVKRNQVLNRLLVLLSSHLKSQLSPTSCPSLFSPVFLLSICDAIRVNSPAEQDDTPALPFVLSKLRDWRVLDPNHRYGSAGVHKLALDLAGIGDKASSNSSHTSRGRLRMKWVGLDPPSENQEPSRSAQASSSSCLESMRACARVLADLNRCRSDACLGSRLGTPDSEGSSAVGSRSSHAASGFRSGCSACRQPRVSDASAPPSPLMTSIGPGTPSGDADQPETHVNTSVVSSGVTEQRPTAKKTRKESNKFLPSTPRDKPVDENRPPRAGIQGSAGVGISFPRQRTHPPRISNASSSREPAATCIQRRIEPSRLPNRTREGDKRMSSHRATCASVDLVLPIARLAHSPRRASPIDLHRQPNRAQSLSSTSVTSHALGSVAQNPTLSSNAVSRSGKLLPFWNQTHRRDPVTPMTRPAILKPDPSSASPAKMRSTLHASSRPWTPSRFPSDTRGASPRPASSHPHRHTQSAGSALPSPRFVAPRWQV